MGKNKDIAIKVIKEEYPGISQQGINALLANIEIETGFQTFVEIPQSYDAVMANSNLSSMQGNLSKLRGGKTAYDKLSNNEKLGVLYHGDKKAKYAGGIGGLQLTSSNYGGLTDFEGELKKIAATLNMKPEDLYNKAKTDPETAIRFSLVHLRDSKNVNVQELNVSDGKTLRKQHINPYETQGVATSDQVARNAIFTSYTPKTKSSSTTVSQTYEIDEETTALLTNLKTSTDESSGKRSYTVTEDDLKIVDGAEKNIREYYISEYSDQSLDDDDLMMGGDGSSDSESIFDKISTELSSGLDMQTERGQAIFKARLESYKEKVTTEEYVENLRSAYQGPSLRTPLTNDMAYTNIVQDTNFISKVLGQTVNSAMKQNDVVIETRDFNAQGVERGVKENLGKIPGTNQDAITTAQIIAKKLAKQGNKELADLLMQEGGSELAGQYILDEIAKQSLNKDEQGAGLNLDNLSENLTFRITDPDGYAEKTGQTDINQNSKNLLISVEDQDRLNETKGNSALAKQAQEAQKNNDTKVFDDYKAYEEWVSKDPKRAEKKKVDPEGLYKEFTNKDAVEEQNKQNALSQQEQDEQRNKRLQGAEMALSGLKAAAGVLSLSKAMQDPDIDIPEISPLVMEAVEKQRAMSKSGLTSSEKGAAMQNMNNAYAGAMKNVLRASGGQRGMFLANQGTVDSQRIQGLNQLAAQDAALHRQNIGQFNQLASSVGQMKLQRDMTAEQMKQSAIQQNKQMLGGIGSNLVSDAMSDLSWYMNPNRGLIEQAQRTSLEGMLGGSGDNTYDTDDGYTVSGNNSRTKETAEQKAERARQKQINDLNN